MLDLVAAEIADRFGQFGIVIAQRAQLLAIVAVDLCLYGGRAGHGGARSHQRSRRAKRMAGNLP